MQYKKSLTGTSSHPNKTKGGGALRCDKIPHLTAMLVWAINIVRGPEWVSDISTFVREFLSIRLLLLVLKLVQSCLSPAEARLSLLTQPYLSGYTDLKRFKFVPQHEMQYPTTSPTVWNIFGLLLRFFLTRWMPTIYWTSPSGYQWTRLLFFFMTKVFCI